MNEGNHLQQDVVTRRMKQVFVLFVVIGGFFLLAEHRAHVLPWLPWLLLAACPLMHIFMHHGHGGHHHGAGSGPEGWNGQRAGGANLPSQHQQGSSHE